MTSNKRKERLLKDLKDKKQRDAFVSALIDTGIPFQIKALREQRNWTQKELGEHINPIMNQVRISVLEDPNYAKLTLTTLKRLASAFDVGLIVRFAPLSELVKWELNLSSESLKASSFDQDPYFQEEVETITVDRVGIPLQDASSNVVSLKDYLAKKNTVSSSQRSPLSVANYG